MIRKRIVAHVDQARLFILRHFGWQRALYLDWRASIWLLRRGIWQAKEEGGYFADCRLAHPRYWFRGRAPEWGKLA